MDYKYVILALIVGALVTFVERALPFVIFSKKEMPSIIKKLENDLPPAIIGALVVYCLKDVPSLDVWNILYLGIAVLIVVLTYIFRKNVLISIGFGTLAYMLLLYFL